MSNLAIRQPGYPDTSVMERWARGFAPPSFEGFAVIGASLCGCEALPAGGVTETGPILGLPAS